MKIFLLALLLFAPGLAWGQGFQRITICGTGSPPAGGTSPGYQDATGRLCVTGSVQIAPYTYTPLGCPAWLSVGTGAAVALSTVSGGIPAGSTLATFAPSGAVNYRDDGSAPTSSDGVPVQANTIFPYSGTLSALQFLSQSGTVNVAVCFYK